MERSYPQCYRSQLLIPYPFSNVTFISSYRYLPTVFCRTMLLAFSVPGEPVVVALRCLIGACPGWSRLQPLEKDLSTEDFGNSCPTPAKMKLQIYSLLFCYHQMIVDVFFQTILKLDGINLVTKASMNSKAKPALTLRDTQTFSEMLVLLNYSNFPFWKDGLKKVVVW